MPFGTSVCRSEAPARRRCSRKAAQTRTEPTSENAVNAKFAERPPTFIWVVQAHILDDAHKGSSMA